jgi:trehalose 6-phosphate synthase
VSDLSNTGIGCTPAACDAVNGAGLARRSRSAALADASLGDVQSTADAIHTALTTSEETRHTNWQKLFNVSRLARLWWHCHLPRSQYLECSIDVGQYVSKYTAEAWGVSFVNEREWTIRRRRVDPSVVPLEGLTSADDLAVTRLSGHPPAGPMVPPGRKKSGSLSRTSSKASISRRMSHGMSSASREREGTKA